MSPGPTTTAEVTHAVAVLRDACSRLSPNAVGMHEVEGMFDALVTGRRLVDGAVTRLAARYDQAGVWRRNGAKSAADDLSRKLGTGTTRARRRLGTSKRLDTQPATDDALRHGAVSDEQADEISDAVKDAPDCEDELLDSARAESIHELRARAAAARVRADRDQEATRRRLHRQREVCRWNGVDGMGNLLLRLPADAMAELDAALKIPTDHAFAAARHAGRFERTEAYAADVIASRLLGHARPGAAEVAASGTDATPADPASPPAPTPTSRSRSQAVRPDKKVIAVIDINALNRGRTAGDEQCEIAGVGPVSVAAVRRLMNDAFLSVVCKDGVDIRSVVHLGRQVTAHQRTALEARGGACEFCGSTFRVEIDHVEGWALTHTTTIDDLSLKCWSCHDRKTRLGLKEAGPPGNRHFLQPDGTSFPTARQRRGQCPGPEVGIGRLDAGAARPHPGGDTAESLRSATRPVGGATRPVGGTAKPRRGTSTPVCPVAGPVQRGLFPDSG